jgi:anti-anti-sigma regulatory factor
MSSALSPTQSIKNEEQILHSFEISGDLRIRDSEKIISDLSVLISENKNILVDLSELSSIDTSIFQILVAMTRSA